MPKWAEHQRVLWWQFMKHAKLLEDFKPTLAATAHDWLDA